MNVDIFGQINADIIGQINVCMRAIEDAKPGFPPLITDEFEYNAYVNWLSTVQEEASQTKILKNALLILSSMVEEKRKLFSRPTRTQSTATSTAWSEGQNDGTAPIDHLRTLEMYHLALKTGPETPWYIRDKDQYAAFKAWASTAMADTSDNNFRLELTTLLVDAGEKRIVFLQLQPDKDKDNAALLAEYQAVLRLSANPSFVLIDDEFRVFENWMRNLPETNYQLQLLWLTIHNNRRLHVRIDPYASMDSTSNDGTPSMSQTTGWSQN